MGLGTLLFGLMLGGSAIRCGIENKQMMSKPYRYLDDGTPVYLDRLCNEHINGEKVISKFNYELERTQQVGSITGKIYFDEVDVLNKRMSQRDKKELELSKNYGRLSYLKWYPEYERALTTEISTGRIIAALYENEHKNIYRKFYLKNKPVDKIHCTESDDGDFGIPISREEYLKLNIIGGTHSKTATCVQIIYAIGTEEDPYCNVHPE